MTIPVQTARHARNFFLFTKDFLTDSGMLLDVSGSRTLRSIYGDLCDTLTLGIAVSAQNTERILAMIDYLEI